MHRLLRVLLIASIAWLPRVADAAPTLFRIYLADGNEILSYGEYARVGDDVVFSVPVGGTQEEPRLQLVTMPATSVDWPRTEHQTEVTRASHYAATRGEEDFLQLTNEVARILNQIALSTDRTRALELARQAHDVLAQWPRTHYHYRESELRDILAIVDNAMATIAQRSDAPDRGFDLSLVASTAEMRREPLIPMPGPEVQLTQLLRVVDVTTRPADRMALLQTARAMLDDVAAGLTRDEVSSLRKTIDRQIEHEQDVDRRYARLSQRLTTEAQRAAASAKAADVERVLEKLDREDEKLGRDRPQTTQALRASLEVQLDNARRLRLLRDQWMLRRAAYEDYEDRVGDDLMLLVKARPQLEAIRKLEGPAPRRLIRLSARLAGGAERLARLPVPPEVQSAHELLVSAWRFAENAARGRYDAVTSGNLSTAWMASSAAAGALMLLSRAQDDIRTLLEIPRLQ